MKTDPAAKLARSDIIVADAACSIAGDRLGLVFIPAPTIPVEMSSLFIS